MGQESAWNICRYTVCGPMRHRHSAVEGRGQRTCRTSSGGPSLPEVKYSLLTGHELAIRRRRRRGKGVKIEDGRMRDAIVEQVGKVGCKGDEKSNQDVCRWFSGWLINGGDGSRQPPAFYSCDSSKQIRSDRVDKYQCTEAFVSAVGRQIHSLFILLEHGHQGEWV